MKPTLILITGAASGIGHHLATHFQKNGIPMILMDFAGDVLRGKFPSSDRLRLIDGDVAKEATWIQAIDSAKEMGLPISHLINCAGVIRPGFLADFSISDIDYHLGINAKGSILGTTLVGREMKNQGFGHIINVSSLAGIAPVSGLGLYTASKFAIRGFSLAVAAELQDFGVEVSVVCPDLVDTPMLDLQLLYPEEAKLTFSGPKKVLKPEDITQKILQLIEKPQRQICIPESRGLLAKIAGAWPRLGELFRNSLEKKGEKEIKNRTAKA